MLPRALPGRRGLTLLLLAAGLLPAARLAHAQTAPPWQLATGLITQTNQQYSTVAASATDAAGNVYLVGSFTGTLVIGNSQLTSASAFSADFFVAKWDVAAQDFLWAVRGGGLGNDNATGVAVSGRSVYVTGTFASGQSAVIGGQALPGVGSSDVFVARYIDTSTGHTLATSGVANGWVVSAGGPGPDQGQAIAVGGTGAVYVTGSLSSDGGTIAGQALSSAGSDDLFVAKYLDTSTGDTPAASSVANGWATVGGGQGIDRGLAVAVSGSAVYVAGTYGSGQGAVVSGQLLTGAGQEDLFVARYNDAGTGSVGNGWAASGGGLAYDEATSLVVRGAGVYVAGKFASGTGAIIAGRALPGTGANNYDLFVAKYLDTSTGSTPATSSYAAGWVVSGGGTSAEQCNGLAVRGSGVYVAGYFSSGTGAVIAGQTLAGTGGADLFVAKYVDTSTGNTSATSSVANGWVAAGGGVDFDWGVSLAVSGQQVYVGGQAASPATFGNWFVPGRGGPEGILAYLTDPTLQPLAATTAPAGVSLALYPNPAPGGAARLVGAAPGTAVQVLDALGRTVATATVGADGTARLVGLAPGLYLVRAGAGTARLAVE